VIQSELLFILLIFVFLFFEMCTNTGCFCLIVVLQSGLANTARDDIVTHACVSANTYECVMA